MCQEIGQDQTESETLNQENFFKNYEISEKNFQFKVRRMFLPLIIGACRGDSVQLMAGGVLHGNLGSCH